MRTRARRRSRPPVLASIILLALAGAAQARDPVDTVTTSDGRTFKNVTVRKVEADTVLLFHSEGAVNVPLANLSDESRKSLGLRTRDEQAAFEAEQARKGLVKYGNDWVTPEEKNYRDIRAQDEEIKALLQKAVKGVVMPADSLPQAVAMLKQTLVKDVTFTLDPDPALNLSNVVVTLNIEGHTTLCTLLNAMLRPNKLDFTISNGGIYISSPEGCIREAGGAIKQKLDEMGVRAIAPATKELEACLDKSVAGAGYIPAGTPLQKALVMLNSRIAKNISFVLDSDSNPRLQLEAVRITDLSWRDSTLRALLNAMLRPNGLDFTISNGGIYISTPEACRREAAQQALKCVVFVYAGARVGSGFFVNSAGLIVTSQHVVGPNLTLAVQPRYSRPLLGKVLRHDLDRDLALIQVDGSDFPFLRLAPDVEIGADVLAMPARARPSDAGIFQGKVIGLPVKTARFATDTTLTDGVALVENDAPSKHGDSGGPLISVQSGEVVGVDAMAGLGVTIGHNFAVSAKEILAAFPDLKME